MATKNVLPQPIDYPAQERPSGLIWRRLKAQQISILPTAILIAIICAAALFRGVV